MAVVLLPVPKYQSRVHMQVHAHVSVLRSCVFIVCGSPGVSFEVSKAPKGGIIFSGEKIYSPGAKCNFAWPVAKSCLGST